jgi:hypothetical protein
MREKFWFWLAWRLPRPLVYFATIRCWANATTGEYGSVDAPAATVADALKRWER